MQIIKYGLASLRRHPLIWGCLLLAGLTLLNNWPVSYFDFAWDDYGYIVRNYAIQEPVSLRTLKWCATQFAEANWHPLTWLALNIQYNCFGLDPRGYHIVNLALHTANVLLLFTVLCRLTGAVGKSLVVAALFSVHPLHVESVAWISEIKDVLSTFFLMLVLHAHVGYARRPGLGRYATVFAALTLGLASKPMLVTAPFVLLLLDVWPLGRYSEGPPSARPDRPSPRFGAGRLLLEKLPLLVLVVATCVLTVLAQRKGGAVAPLDAFPMLLRLTNVANSYLLYLWRLLWPWPLSFFYGYANISLARALACLAALAAVSYAAYAARRRAPYLAFGWLWYLGTLVPVIGLVQVGSQAMADRYTYIPSIGILVAAVWLLADLCKRLGLDRLFAPVLALGVVAAYMLVSFAYVNKWANETTLYEYALSVNENNTVALNNYAGLLKARGEKKKMTEYFNKLLTLSPNSPIALNNLALLQEEDGNRATARNELLLALKHNQNYIATYINLASICVQDNDMEMAEQLLHQARTLEPDNSIVSNSLGELLMERHKEDQALEVLRAGLEQTYDKDPIKAFLLNNLGVLWLSRQDYPHAVEALERALVLQPQFALASRNLARVQLARQDTTAALAQLRKTLTLAPTDGVTLCLLGQLYLDQKQYGRAYIQFRRALAVSPTLADAHEGLAAALTALGQPDAAMLHNAKALDLRSLLRTRPSTAKPPTEAPQ